VNVTASRRRSAASARRTRARRRGRGRGEDGVVGGGIPRPRGGEHPGGRGEGAAGLGVARGEGVGDGREGVEAGGDREGVERRQRVPAGGRDRRGEQDGGDGEAGEEPSAEGGQRVGSFAERVVGGTGQPPQWHLD
jgi:hypothetical protein